jgi:hypothetical protein
LSEQNINKLTAIIKEIAEDVYRTVGSGFSEDVYDRAMQVDVPLPLVVHLGAVKLI